MFIFKSTSIKLLWIIYYWSVEKYFYKFYIYTLHFDILSKSKNAFYQILYVYFTSLISDLEYDFIVLVFSTEIYTYYIQRKFYYQMHTES